MNKKVFIWMLFTSCYTAIKKPDVEFMNTIKQQAALAPDLQTHITVTPAKLFFSFSPRREWVSGQFWVKNQGSIDFKIVDIKANCECIEVNYTQKEISPKDSLLVKYKIRVSDFSGSVRNTIVVIGNCPFGNATFYLEGSIVNNKN